MLQHCHPRLATALVALAFTALTSAAIAQDQPRPPPDQPQRPDQPAPNQTHRNVRPGHGAQVRGDEHPDHADADTVARYRRAHPHAAARCHDGFFTNTTDRARACSKHGGIDVWLRE